MYSCVSKPKTDEEREARLELEQKRQTNKKIEKLLHENKDKSSCVKLLLLGTGESGKSTILKQMKIIHIDGFSDSEKKEFIPIIKRNIRDSILAIIVAMVKLNIKPKNFNVSDEAKYLEQAFNVDFKFTAEYFDRVVWLWKDEDVQYCYSRSNEYQLIDSAEYFLEKIHEIRQLDYIPSLQDILRCRKMTNAITEINFEVKERKGEKVHFKVFDVGGQQGERKRWIQLFGDVTAILFLTDCSSFDQTLRENRTKNRLFDSLEVFNQAWMNRYLQHVPILLFINKIDLLDRKIKSGHTLTSLFQYINNFSKTSFSLTQNCLSLEPNFNREGFRRRSNVESVRYSKEINGNYKNSISQKRESNEISNISSNISNITTSTATTNNQAKLINSGISGNHSSSNGGSNRKLSCKTVPSSSRRTSKDTNIDFVYSVVRDCEWTDFEPTNKEKKSFLSAFPEEYLEECESVGPFSANENYGSNKKSKTKLNSDAIHPDTVKTACFIKYLFLQVIQSQPKSLYNETEHKRKFLSYYTCAVNTNNIEKVLNGCRSFLVQEHLERFGIL